MEKENINKSSEKAETKKSSAIGRRDVIKTLATVPLLGAMAYGLIKTRKNVLLDRDISDVFQLSTKNAVFIQPLANGKPIRVGLIGFGIRGKQLMRALGFAEPSYMDSLVKAREVNPDDTRYDVFMEQGNLNVVINGVCDIFDLYSESAHLLTHEYDAVNQIMHLGIPKSATSSGGVYFFKDGRTVPDVLQTTFEWPDRNLIMLYSATLASSRNRGKVFMGHDASMEVSNILSITADSNSERYAEKIKQGIIPTDKSFFTYVPGQSKVDAVTSATELYFAQRGLLYTYVDGKRYDTTHLHMREWLECIRQGQTPSCNIDQAFMEAMTAHMGTRAYLEGRTMYWDKDKEEIIRGEYA